MYDTLEETALRLHKTVIMGPHGPVYVADVNGPGLILVREFRYHGGLKDSYKEITLPDPKYSVKPFRLGNMNYQGYSYYLQRIPQRKYKQGLCASAIYAGNVVLDRNNILFNGKSFIDMVNNKYPSALESYGMLDGGNCISSAFHREWSFQKIAAGIIVLRYKRNIVGNYDTDNGFRLDSGREYLTESLMEALK